jgi:hypothetical protein
MVSCISEWILRKKSLALEKILLSFGDHFLNFFNIARAYILITFELNLERSTPEVDLTLDIKVVIEI